MSEQMSLKMPADLRQRLRLICDDEDVTEGAFIRDAVAAAIKKSERARRRAKRRDSVDEPLLSRLRVIVAGALVASNDWESLLARLAEKDLAYAPKGGGLGLERRSSGEDLCKASDVGPGYALLVRRFQAPFPNHPHAWIGERVLGDLVPRGGRAAEGVEVEDDVLEIDD